MDPSTLKIISLNIEYDRHLHEVIAFLKYKQPDVVLLQEILEVDLPLFEEALDMKSVFTGLNYLDYPRGILKLGLATLSRLPIFAHQAHYYRGSAEALPTIVPPYGAELMARALLVTEVNKAGVPYRLINIYFTWCSNAVPTEQQLYDFQKVLAILLTIPDFVMCGDLNSPRGQMIFDTLSQLYQDNIPLDITTTIDKTLHKAGHLNIVVDGMFTTKNYDVSDVTVIHGISDHCAICAHIQHHMAPRA